MDYLSSVFSGQQCEVGRADAGGVGVSVGYEERGEQLGDG